MAIPSTYPGVVGAAVTIAGPDGRMPMAAGLAAKEEDVRSP